MQHVICKLHKPLCAAPAQVTFDPDIVGPRTLLEVVEGIGYNATLEDDDTNADRDGDPAAADRRFWRRKVCWSAVFTVPVFLLGMVHLWPHPSLYKSLVDLTSRNANRWYLLRHL